MLSFSVSDATYGALKRRVEYFDVPQNVLIAIRITATTPGATRCPNFDINLGTETVHNDPTCLGTGWIIPANAQTGAPLQAGYLTAQGFDCVVVAGETTTQQQEDGTIEYMTGAMAYWPPRQTESGLPIYPKKGDVLIVTTVINPVSKRYVFGDVSDPGVLGSLTLLYKGTLEARRADDIIYQIPPIDNAGLTPGSWT